MPAREAIRYNIASGQYMASTGPGMRATAPSLVSRYSATVAAPSARPARMSVRCSSWRRAAPYSDAIDSAETLSAVSRKAAGHGGMAPVMTAIASTRHRGNAAPSATHISRRLPLRLMAASRTHSWRNKTAGYWTETDIVRYLQKACEAWVGGSGCTDCRLTSTEGLDSRQTATRSLSMRLDN